ncbi:unnamed protein product [Allacma fusca]|uniref:ABC transporter domain-containing protein n=1 Tax=Allacma fusca TaxID=39272 RepID=A0A8J2KGE9_9HEXA|nr:unnamed protein product [Allacma fusca]
MESTPPLGGKAPASFWKQTWLLSRKNFLTKRRQDIKKLIGEIVIPIFYLGFLCWIVSSFEVQHYRKQDESLETPLNVLYTGTPRILRMKCNCLGLILPTVENPEWNSEFKFKYDIRLPSTQVPFPSKKVVEITTCRQLEDKIYGLEPASSCPVNEYYFDNFLALQQLVEMTVLQKNLVSENSNATVKLTVTMEGFPKDEYMEGMPVYMRVMIPLYSVIPLAQVINNLLVLIVTEKESRIKDGLRMVGVSDVAYWLSWFSVYGLLTTLFAVVFTVIMSTMGVLGHMNPIILFLLFFLFGLSVITLAFSLTPFFHKPRTAGVAGTMILQFLSLLFLLQTFVPGVEQALMPLKLISSLAFTAALDEACLYEYSGGIQWSDLVPGGRGEGIMFSLIFLAFDVFFYLLIAYYLDHVIPNEFGVKKHPFFILKPSFWKGSSKGEEFTELIDDVSSDTSSISSQNCEPVGLDMKGKEAIRIRNIKKTYTSWNAKSRVEAVKDVSLDIYGGQITAILGKNGAGKSTLFNILTGLVSPTSGTAVVFGLNTSVPQDMQKLRKIVGVCLQHDLHFSALTVEEHLQFYGELRGLEKEELKKEIDVIIHELKLNDRRHALADKLSGGQKRKLSIGIALIGDPKVILLDEPTAGLDPVSRRHLWTLLQQKKRGKVILLTTHFMDEADILADRKAIVHNGVLKCVGSSLYLKNRYGVGYYLTVEMNDRYLDTSISDSIIEKWIPDALSSKKVIAHEIKYSLPHSETSKFAGIFAEFEREIAKGATLNSYGVSMTTLEEVFLKISNDMDLSDSNDLYANTDSSEQNLIENVGKVTTSFAAILLALFLMRFRRLMRSPQSVFFMVVMPIIMAAIGLVLLKISINTTDSLDFSSPTGIYPSSDLRVAVHENDTKFSRFVGNLLINCTDYSGKFPDLLEVNKGKGSLAAINIVSERIDPRASSELTVAMRVNGTYLHSPVLVLDLITKYFSESLSNQSNTFVTTSLRSTPFPERDEIKLLSQASSFASLLLGPAFVFPCVGMVMEIVKDRETKARNHLRVNGVSFGIYFGSFFGVFTLLMLIPTVSQVVLITSFGVEAYMNPYSMVVITGIILLFIIPALLFSSIFSYMFDKPDSAQSIFSAATTYSGMIMLIVILLVDGLAKSRTLVVALNALFCFINVFFVPYAIYYWTNKQYVLHAIKSTIGEAGGINFSTYNTMEINTILVCLLVQIPLFSILLVAVDVIKSGGNPFHALMTTLSFRKSMSAVECVETGNIEEEPRDEDVAREKTRVQKHFSGLERNDNCVIAVNNLRKKYKHKKKTRVVLNGVNLMVEKGEVFGLLGHNGAGKTTTMKMITAEESPNDGKIQLCGYDITSNLSKAFSELGFCPQHDALWENISLREHLELYAIIRGIPADQRKRLVAHFLMGLRIQEHSEKYSEKLSGGTKRKLSYAMSMLGAPKMVLMDEPSTGMDPQSKRFLWNTVLGTFKDSRGAVLTTHSMEEADVLCGRIGIMVKGGL